MKNVIIGANIQNRQCYQVQEYVCNNLPFVDCSSPDDTREWIIQCRTGCWQWKTRCINAELNGQSDGFIPAVSQTGYGSRSWGGVQTVEALGVNHSEEHDSTNTKMKLIFGEVFNGDYGLYFKTDRRPR
jgi:hypothetical protein